MHFAEGNDIYISDFKDFTGNIKDVKHMISKIANVRSDFPNICDGKKKVTLGLFFSDSDDFAYTDKRKIFINGFYLNDIDLYRRQYQKMVDERYFVSGTTSEDVIYHELGHLVCNVYKIDSLRVAKDILNYDEVELVKFLMENLSIYSANKVTSNLTESVFDGSEIIAECFCAYYAGTNNSFATKYVERCKMIAEERRC